MPSVSLLTTFWFLAIVAAVFFALTFGMWASGRRLGEPASDRVHGALLGGSIAAAWLTVSGVVAASGVLAQFHRRPPPMMLLLIITTAATTALAFSKVGTRLVTGAGIAGLIGYQVFRLPLELWLHHASNVGLIPVQMTFAGSNFDILTGISALVVGLWAMWRTPPRAVVWLWNLVGLGLLVTIVSIAVMSIPGPLLRYTHEPVNRIVAYFPFVWLPAFLVQAAWFGHLLVLRWLWQSYRRPR